MWTAQAVVAASATQSASLSPVTADSGVSEQQIEVSSAVVVEESALLAAVSTDFGLSEQQLKLPSAASQEHVEQQGSGMAMFAHLGLGFKV